MLEGSFIEQNLNEGMRLLNLAMKNDNLYAYYAYGLYLFSGIHGLEKNEERGLSYIKKAANGGCIQAQNDILIIAEKKSLTIDAQKIRNKLIQKGKVFFDRDSNVFDYLFVYFAAVEADKKNYDEAFKILQKGIDINCVFCMTYYADLLKDNERISEAKKMKKKAADFGDKQAIKEYVYSMENGELGEVDPLELSEYKELLSFFSFD